MSVPIFVSLPTGIGASAAPRGATEMTLNFVIAVPKVSTAFSARVRASLPYSRSGSNNRVRGDLPAVALRLYSDISTVPLLSRPLETGTVIFPHSIAPHGRHLILSVVASAACTGEVGTDVIPKMRAAPTQMARSGRANVT